MSTDNPYESIKDAVEFHEKVPLPWSTFGFFLVGPQEVVRICCRQADEMLNDLKWAGKPESRELEAARPQMDSPLFVQWVAGKMGAM